MYVACDSAGNVYVVDTDNHRIQVFTAEGKFLRMFGRVGGGRGELADPISITIYTSDRVYVGDFNHHISVFTSNGHFITSFGQKGKRPGEFDSSFGLAVDASGVVYVCDTENHRILVAIIIAVVLGTEIQRFCLNNYVYRVVILSRYSFVSSKYLLSYYIIIMSLIALFIGCC